MKKNAIWFFTAVALLLLIVLASHANAGMFAPDAERAKQASAGEIVGDLLFIRPITLGLTFLGAGALIVSAPFTLMGQNFTRSAEVLFIDPAMYTFGYPLGSY